MISRESMDVPVPKSDNWTELLDSFVEKMCSINLSVPVELPEDIWGMILGKLSLVDKLRMADKVCSSWRRLCMDDSMYRVIDLKDQKGLPLIVLTSFLFRAIERSQGKCIELSYGFCGSSDVVHIVERSKGLKRLWLRGWTSSSLGIPIYQGLLKVVQNLTFLEELCLQECIITPACIEALGIYCPKLRSFGLVYFHGLSYETEEEKDEDALAIAVHLSLLCQLQFIGSSVTNRGVEAILDGCPSIKSLDLRRCFDVDIRGSIADRCAKLDAFWHPTDSMEDFLF